METNMDQDVINLAKAIRQVESGGDYNAKGKSGEIGAFQWMPDTWSGHAKEVLGDPKAPMTPENQKAVAYVKLKQWKEAGLNPAQIAAKWNSGSESGWENKIGVNRQGVPYNVPEYVKKVTDTYQMYKKGEKMNQSDYVLPESSAPQQQERAKYTGVLGTDKTDRLTDKLIDNTLTRGLIRAVPGSQALGDVLGTAGGAIKAKAKDLFKGTKEYQNYDLKTTKPWETTKAGAKVVGSAMLVKGVGAIANRAIYGGSAVNNKVVLDTINKTLKMPGAEFKTLSGVEKLNAMTEAIPRATAAGKIALQKAIQEITPMAIKEMGLAPSVATKVVGMLMNLVKGGVGTTAKGLGLLTAGKYLVDKFKK